MIPFFIFYSMFGFQRVGDLIWAAGDSRARGFLIGGTSGRTTLNGEGLQHQDGHSHLMAATIPNCRAYDPTYAYEVAVIVQDGLRRMLTEQEDVFYYLTVMNENYPHPAHAGGRRGGHPRAACTCVRERPRATGRGCAAGLRARSCARCSPPPTCCRGAHGVAADVWSVTSFTELRRDGMEAERWSRLHPHEEPPRPLRRGSARRRPRARWWPRRDYMRAFADGIRAFVPRALHVLGTDGFGRSDYRVKLRRFFEVDRHHVAVGRAVGARRARARSTPATAAAGDRRATTSTRRRWRRGCGERGHASRTSATSTTSRSSRCWSAPGDTVAAEDPLIVLESDKASMEVPSPAAGTVDEVVGEGGRRRSPRAT